MSFLYPTRIVNLFSPLFGYGNKDAESQPLVANEVVAYQGKTMKVIVSQAALAQGSVQVMPCEGTKSFGGWTVENKAEAYDLLQKVVQVWKEKGITDYLTYGKESENAKSIFSLEIVPYPKTNWRFLKQFQVLWRITFGGTSLSKIQQQTVAKDFQNRTELFSEQLRRQIESVQVTVKGGDPFCNSERIQKQLVFEGKEINVLYNYAPIALGKGGYHFLLVPKQHRSKFSDLTETEYLETMQLSNKLIRLYKEKGWHTAYLFDKTGAAAGQTVPHWHEHLVFAATKTEDFFGKLTVLKNMLVGSSPLSSKELQRRVDVISKELN